MSYKSIGKTKKRRKVSQSTIGDKEGKRQNHSPSLSRQVPMPAKSESVNAVKSLSYAGVLPELKRIGIIAGSAFLALIILYLLLR